MNPGRTPGGILSNHAEDELAHFPADAFSSNMDTMPREPRPIQLEPCPMPANNCLRLNENQCLPPSTPEPPQNQPVTVFQKEQAVASDAGVSKRPAAASGLSFPKGGCDENR